MKATKIFLLLLATQLIASQVQPMVFDTIRRYDTPDPGLLVSASNDGVIAVIYGTQSLNGFVVDSLFNVPNVSDTIASGSPSTGFSARAFEIKPKGTLWFVPYAFHWTDDAWPFEDHVSDGYIILDSAMHVIKRVVFYEGVNWSNFYVVSASLAFADTLGFIPMVVGGINLCGVFINDSNQVLDSFAILSVNNPVIITQVKTLYIGDNTFLIVWSKGVKTAGYQNDSIQLYYTLITTDGNIIYPDGRQFTFDYVSGKKEIKFLSYLKGRLFVVWKDGDRWYDIKVNLNKDTKAYSKLIFEDKRIQSISVLPIDDSFIVFWIDSLRNVCYYAYLHEDGSPAEGSADKIFGSENHIYDVKIERFDSTKWLILYHTVADNAEKVAMRRVLWNKSTGKVVLLDNSDFIPMYYFHSYYPVVGVYTGEDDKVAVVAQDENGVLHYGVSTFGPYFEEIGRFSRGCWFAAPEIARNNNGLYLLVWSDGCSYVDWDYGYISGPDIRGYLFDLSYAVSEPMFIMADDSVYTNPHVAAMDDRFIATWQKKAFYDETLLNSGYRIIYGPCSMGNIDSVEYKITGVAFDGVEALLVGKIEDTLGEEDSIVGTFVNKNGERMGTVSIAALDIVYGPFVVSDSSKFLVVYSGRHEYDNGNKIFGQFVYPDGSVSEAFEIYGTLPRNPHIKVVYDGFSFDVFLTGYPVDTITLVRITPSGEVSLTMKDIDINPDLPARVWPSTGFGVVEDPGRVLFMYTMYVDRYEGIYYKTYGYVGKVYDFTEIEEGDVQNTEIFYDLLGAGDRLVVNSEGKDGIFAIYDIGGRAVYTRKIDRNSSLITVLPQEVGLRNGIYYYIIYGRKGISKKGKFIFLK